MTTDPVAAQPPSRQGLVAELGLLRRAGLLRVHEVDLPGLTALAVAVVGERGLEPHRLVEPLLVRACQGLGDGELAEATGYLFGLLPGTRGWSPTRLRARAAQVFDREPDTFRKHHEPRVIGELAEELVKLGVRHAAPVTTDQSVAQPDPHPTQDRDRLQADAALADAAVLTGRPVTEAVHRFGPYDLEIGDGCAQLCVDVGAMAELPDVHLLVSSENLLLQPDRYFAPTLSGHLRGAVAVRDPAGTVLDDVTARELAQWLGRHARPGLPVHPGVVVPTSPGALRAKGVRRILHAAVAAPLQNGGYDVPADGVRRAVRECFVLARAERADDPEVRAIALPLFGAGNGRVPAAEAFANVASALVEELRADPSSRVHLAVWTWPEAVVVLRGRLDRRPSR